MMVQLVGGARALTEGSEAGIIVTGHGVKFGVKEHDVYGHKDTTNQ